MEQGSKRVRVENHHPRLRRHSNGWVSRGGKKSIPPFNILLTGKDFDRLSKAFKIWYGINVEQKEHAIRGWNWGKAEFGRAELAFNVQNRPAFEIPYSEISNTNLAAKTEVAVEFNLGAEPTTNGVNGQKAGHTKNRGRKAAAARDELVEMRFYIPGTVAKKDVNGEDKDDAGSGDDNKVDDEEQNAANLFYETLMDKAEIGDVAGDTIATFQDVLHLTPRGRFDIDMYETSMRLRGKTYDYKIQYDSIKKFFMLQKNDEIHTLVTIGLDPPLRQGQTRYPFIVMQMKDDEEVSLELNMTEETLKKYNGKLSASYEAPIHHIFAIIYRGLTGRKVNTPSQSFTSHQNLKGVKCSIKANEGSLYCLDKSFLFVPKPATYIEIDKIASISLSRVGGALPTSRTFDLVMKIKGGGDHTFSNVNREEMNPLIDFFKVKNIRYKNEMVEDTAALKQVDDLGMSSDDGSGLRGSAADDDDETPDEDFQADSDSDVAEEYDSDAESSGSGGGSDAGADVEMDEAGAGGNTSDEEEEDTRPKKKTKTKG